MLELYKLQKYIMTFLKLFHLNKRIIYIEINT